MVVKELASLLKTCFVLIIKEINKTQHMNFKIFLKVPVDFISILFVGSTKDDWVRSTIARMHVHNTVVCHI